MSFLFIVSSGGCLRLWHSVAEQRERENCTRKGELNEKVILGVHMWTVAEVWKVKSLTCLIFHDVASSVSHSEGDILFEILPTASCTISFGFWVHLKKDVSLCKGRSMRQVMESEPKGSPTESYKRAAFWTPALIVWAHCLHPNLKLDTRTVIPRVCILYAELFLGPAGCKESFIHVEV